MMKCVAFDFDGTLVDSNQVKVQAFYEIAKDVDPSGLTVTNILRRCSNKDRYGITRELAGEYIAKGMLPIPPDPVTIAAQWAEAYTSACERAIAQCPEVPGASRILTWLTSEKIPLYLNSRTPIEALSPLVAARNLTHYFSGIYGAPASKLENLRQIQEHTQAKPNEILFVGDSDDDMNAAAVLGCHFAGVILGDTSRFSRIPTLHVENLAHLRDIVETLNKNHQTNVSQKLTSYSYTPNKKSCILPPRNLLKKSQ